MEFIFYLAIMIICLILVYKAIEKSNNDFVNSVADEVVKRLDETNQSDKEV